MLVFVLLVICASVGWGWLSRKRAHLPENRRVQAALMAALWVGYNIYYFTPSHFDWKVSLPLHVCDLLAPSAAIAIALAVRPARAVLYFCAIALAGQAILTPTGNQDPATLRFWLYWSLHAGILALSFLDLTIIGFRPNLRDFLSVILIDVAYVAVIVPLDVFLNWNYGYLGDKVPDTLTAISLFGPWPRRIFLMVLTVIVLQGIFFLPWLLGRRESRSVS
jgi:hypothetical integral membrane protein (TIGR02206 family)